MDCEENMVPPGSALAAGFFAGSIVLRGAKSLTLQGQESIAALLRRGAGSCPFKKGPKR